MAAITIYPYQRRWLADRSRFKIAMFARQTGKSFTTTLELVDDCLDAEADGRKVHWVILSTGERQAIEVMEVGVKRHLGAYQVGFEAMASEWRADDGETFRSSAVALPGGSRITALPAAPKTARGFSANVFLDEFAFHQDSRSIWKALMPVISAGHKIRICSTPNGKGNKFHELMTNGDPIWSRHVVDIHQAVADGLPRDVDALRTAMADEDAWAQEFECQWLDEASAWLDFELIASCESGEAGEPSRYSGGQTFIGNDIGARGDLWVAWVLERVGDVLWARELRILKRASFAEHEATLGELIERYRPLAVRIDQTGMGEKPVEDARRRWGSRVEGVIFNNSSKQALANEIKDCFQDRRVRVPAGDPVLRADLHRVQRVMSATGMPRFLAERDGAGHADRFWALALAVSAASSPPAPIEFEAIGRERARLDDDFEPWLHEGRRTDLRGW